MNRQWVCIHPRLFCNFLAASNLLLLSSRAFISENKNGFFNILLFSVVAEAGVMMMIIIIFSPGGHTLFFISHGSQQLHSITCFFHIQIVANHFLKILGVKNSRMGDHRPPGDCGNGIQHSSESYHLNKATVADSHSNPPNRPSCRLFFSSLRRLPY